MQAWAINPSLADAPAEMIIVCMGKGYPFKEHLKWFRRAIDAQMDYEEAYVNLFSALQPRWGGDHKYHLIIGATALGTGYFQTDVPLKFLDALNAISLDLESQKEDAKSLWGNPHVMTLIKNMFDGYAHEPSRAALLNWDQSEWSGYLWRSGQMDQARQIVSRLKKQFIEEAFERAAGVPWKTVANTLGDSEPP